MSTILETLTAIYEEKGELTAEGLVADAASPKHPLHDHFEWDDSRAGHLYRVEQARQLLRVTYAPTPGAPTHMRAFVAVRGESTPRAEYKPTEEVLLDPIQRQLLLNQMKRDWATFQRRYEHMAEYAEFLNGIADRITAPAG